MHEASMLYLVGLYIACVCAALGGAAYVALLIYDIMEPDPLDSIDGDFDRDELFSRVWDEERDTH